MALDTHVLNGLVDRFLDGYSEDLVKQLRELRFYPGQAPVIDRLFREKDSIFEKYTAYKNNPLYRLPADKNRQPYREFIEQAVGFVERKVVTHLEEFKKLIADTQGKSGQRNRMSWEVVKANLNLLQTVSYDFLRNLQTYFRENFIPDLVITDTSSLESVAAPSTPSSQSNSSTGSPTGSAEPLAQPKKSLGELLESEICTDVEAKPYDDALTAIETWYAKEKGTTAGPRFSALVKRVQEGIAATMTPLLGNEKETYKTRLERGYVSLKEFRSIADSYQTVLNRMKPMLETYLGGELKPITYETKYETGITYNKKIIYAKLFRNVQAHLGVMRSINQDVYYDVGFYLYYKPAREHYLELKLLFDKVILVRVPQKDKYNQEMKFVGLMFNDMRSQLEEFHSVLQKYY